MDGVVSNSSSHVHGMKTSFSRVNFNVVTTELIRSQAKFEPYKKKVYRTAPTNKPTNQQIKMMVDALQTTIKKNRVPRRTKSMKVSQEDLSYQTMTVEDSGQAVSIEQKTKLREKYGFCTTCPGPPVHCFDINKSRINPLWSAKDPRSVEGECLEGICLKCHPTKDPRRKSFALSKIAASSRRINTVHNQSRRDIQRDLSNGSLALSQSRRDLNRSSHGRASHHKNNNSNNNNNNNDMPNVVREPSIGSMSTGGSSHSVLSRIDSSVSGSLSAGSAHSLSAYSLSASSSHHRREIIHNNNSNNNNTTRHHYTPMSELTRARSSPTRVEESSNNNKRDATTVPIEPQRAISGSGRAHPRPAATSEHASISSPVSPMRRVASLRARASFSQHHVTAMSSSLRLPTMASTTAPPTVPAVIDNAPAFTTDIDSEEGATGIHRATSEGSPVSTSPRRTPMTPPLEESRSLPPSELPREVRRIPPKLNALFKAPATSANCPATPPPTTGMVSTTLVSTPNGSNEIGPIDPSGITSGAYEVGTVDEPLLNLTSLLDELATAGAYDFLIEIALNALQSHKNVEVICLCLDTITKICKQDKTNKKRLGDNGAMMEEICFALKNFGTSENVQTKAASAIACVSGDDKARLALVQSGACRLLVPILQTQTKTPTDTSEAIVGAVVSALRGLSTEASARESLGSTVASKHICKAMELNLSVAPLQRDACAFLSNVSVDMETQQVFPVSSDVFQAIVNALREHHTEEKVASVACFALLNLTCEESNLRALRSIDGVFDVLDQSNDDGTSEIWNYQDAYDLLDRLQLSQAADASLEEQAQESLQIMVALKDGKPEVIPDVVDLLKNFDWSSRVAADCSKSRACLVISCLIFFVVFSLLVFIN